MKADLEVTQTLELADEDVKPVISVVFHVSKKFGRRRSFYGRHLRRSRSQAGWGSRQTRSKWEAGTTDTIQNATQREENHKETSSISEPRSSFKQLNIRVIL